MFFFKQQDSFCAKKHYFKFTKMFDNWGFAPDPTGEFTTLSKTYIAESGWDRNEVRANLRQIP